MHEENPNSFRHHGRHQFLGGADLTVALCVNDFSQVFAALLETTGISCYRIGQYTHLDQGYLSRLKSGDRRNPSPETVLKISLAFTHYNDQVRLYDIQKLFKSVGRSILTSDV
jgi:hypothetical protein